jgi:pimeloyl-ACP methyl ester carboxylesterase
MIAPAMAVAHTAPCTTGHKKVPSWCGSLRVFEDRAAGSGRTIVLRFIVLRAKHETHRAVFWNPGGPGAPATEAAPDIADGAFAKELTALRDDYDIVLLDNRGTGGSHPLQCDFAPPARPSAYFAQLWPDALVKACRARLALGSNLSLYTTSVAADDLDDVRAALGYQRIVLDGGSYGTRFYLAYIRQHPEHVESAILIGVAPPHFLILPLEDAGGAQSAIDRLVDECAADARCRRHFGDFAAQFSALVRRFDGGPISVPVRNAVTKRVETVRLSKEVFADRLRQLLYFPEGAAYVPFIVDRAHRGDDAPLATVLDEVSQSFAQGLAAGLNLSVACAEDIPFITEDAVRRTSANSFEGDLRVRAEQRACSFWKVDPVPASFVEPVRSDAPILMITGSDDPATPPQFAEQALPYLPNARNVVVKGASHATETDCTDRLMVAFVRSGSARGLNLNRCTGAYQRPAFATSMPLTGI